MSKPPNPNDPHPPTEFIPLQRSEKAPPPPSVAAPAKRVVPLPKQTGMRPEGNQPFGGFSVGRTTAFLRRRTHNSMLFAALAVGALVVMIGLLATASLYFLFF